MNTLIRYSGIKVNNTNTKFVRYLYNRIEWTDRLIGITGARGTGKTTLMLQYLKNNFSEKNDALYVSLDDYYFTTHRLFDLAEEFYLSNGKIIFIDEVHRYPGWATEIKNIYDTFPGIRIVFSGSSALQLHKAEADLSRRVALYHLHELSFREYLILKTGEKYTPLSLEEILNNHHKIAPEIINDIRILPHFREYCKTGVYPFFLEAKGLFYERMKNTVNVIIENDLVAVEKLNYQTVYKLKKLIALLSDSVPFMINVSELSRKTELSRDLILLMFKALDRANLIYPISQKCVPTGHFTKPDKIYLNNTALLYALSSNPQTEAGTTRETFFVNQLSLDHKLNSLKKGDFIVDDKYTFEIGGKNKTKKQIAGIRNAYVAADDIEYGYNETIPLWLFGLIY